MKLFDSMLLRKSIADVTMRKARTIGAILGILIGVFGLTSINMFQDTYFKALSYTYEVVHQADITFNVDAVDPSIAHELQDTTNVKEVETKTIFQTQWHIDQAPGKISFMVLGLSNIGNNKINSFELMSGHYPGLGEVVMESGDAGIQKFNIGDSIKVDTPNGEKTLIVSGIARTHGSGNPATKGCALAYMKEQALFQVMGITKPNVIDIRVGDKSKIQQTQEDISKALKEHGVNIQDSVLHIDSVGSNAILNNIFTILKILSIIAIIVSCFLVINTVTTLISEQTHIIGTMKAIGGSQGVIMLGYLFSVIIYTLIGTVMGLGLGTTAGYLLAGKLAAIHNLDLKPFTIPIDVLIIALVGGFCVPILAALYPLRTGTRISVRDAISAYGITNNESVSSSKARTIVSRYFFWVSQTSWLGLRNVFRKPGRAILTICALALSGITFFAISNATFAINSQVDKRYNAYHFDIKVNQIAGVPDNRGVFINTILSIEGVRRLERSGTIQIKTDWGNMDLTGVDQDTELYHPTLSEGRWLKPGEKEALLLSDDVSKRTGLKPGDTITFSADQHKLVWHIIGIVHDPNVSLGSFGNALTSSENLNLIAGIPQNAGVQWYIETKDHTQAEVDELTTKLNSTLNKNGVKYVVTPAYRVIQNSKNEFSDLYNMFYVVAAVIALVGILSLYTTLTSSVLERRHEIGIWRSIGASSRKVATVFLVEGFTLGIIAWIGAIIIGIPLSYGFLQLLGMLFLHAPFAFNPWLFILMLAIIIPITIVSCIGPMLRATKEGIVSLLRYE